MFASHLTYKKLPDIDNCKVAIDLLDKKEKFIFIIIYLFFKETFHKDSNNTYVIIILSGNGV